MVSPAQVDSKSIDFGIIKSAVNWIDFLNQKYRSYSKSGKRKLLSFYWKNKKSQNLALEQIVKLDVANNYLCDKLAKHIFGDVTNGNDTMDYIILSNPREVYDEIMEKKFVGSKEQTIKELEHFMDEMSGYFILDMYKERGVNILQDILRIKP